MAYVPCITENFVLQKDKEPCYYLAVCSSGVIQLEEVDILFNQLTAVELVQKVLEEPSG